MQGGGSNLRIGAILINAVINRMLSANIVRISEFANGRGEG